MLTGMPRTTTIKVPVEVRDRLAEIARRSRTTLAGAIEQSLAMADTAQFWAEVDATMSRGDRADAAERLAPTLSDGLEPDEDWSDVL